MLRQRYLVFSAVVLWAVALVANAQTQYPGEPGELGSGIICKNCVASSQIQRDKTAPDIACVDRFGPQAPLRWFVGRCIRYQCDDRGRYYVWSGWQAIELEHRTNLEKDDPESCPSATCIYIPWISDFNEATPNKLTSVDTVRLIRQALK